MPTHQAGQPPRWRRGLAVVCLVLAGLLLPVGLLAGWANATFYDSDTFSQRAVDLLDSSAVRRELADKLTQQLALNGNQQAVNFRPGFQLAIEAAIDTDTFRSIFRTAVRRTHQAVLSGQTKGTGLDLSDSISIIAGTLQLPDAPQPGERDERALGSSLNDTTDRLAGLFIWRLSDLTETLTAVGLAGSVVAAAAAIALATDRRRMVRLVGWVVVADGLVISALVLGAQWYAGRTVGDAQLAAAVRGALSHGTADLSRIGLWTAGYGVILAAAARREGARPLTPANAVSAIGAWAERSRATTGGTVTVGVAAIAAGLLLVSNPEFWLKVGLVVTGLWLAYFGATALVSLVRAAVPSASAAGASQRRTRRLVLVGALCGVLVLALTAGVVVSTRRAANQANAAGVQRCNGETTLCDLPLNLALFPGTHNSMSSALYPGWLFAEHVKTIGGQLNEGARALLFDTHYGVPSSARLPGSETPLILTDRAAELSQPAAEQIDPATAQKAAELAGRAPPKANASREIYLCHNYCELGAVRFADALGEIKTFLDQHPDDVVITIIQDATSPEATAAAIEQAGLGPRVYTLEPDKPLPTLGDMVRAGRTLLVFAEVGGPGAPPWYQKAYETWFQETPYSFTDAGQMTCGPNRGPSTAPLFLVNHWVTSSPPDPRKAGAVNRRGVLENRVRQCQEERGLLPNIVAVDFAERGDVVDTLRDVNAALLDQVQQARRGARRPRSASVSTTSLAPGSTAASPSGGPPIPSPTQVTSLTGGDPRAFCERGPLALSVIGDWALANVAAPPAGKGLSDLAYGPAAARVIAALHEVAPAELARLMEPARDRSHAAVQALRDLGFDQSAIDDLADFTEQQLAGSDYPDPVAVQTAMLERIGSKVERPRLNAAAASFAASHPEPSGLFDLGDVPDDVARDAGYECLIDQ